MSSIGSVIATSYTPQSTPTGGVQATPRVTRSDSDDDGGGKKVHRHGNHGHERGERSGSLQDALMQALKSMGLSIPQSPQGGVNPPASTPSTTDGTKTPVSSSGTAPATQTTAPAAPPPPRGEHGDQEGDGDDDDHQSAASGIQADIRQFMHALFQAVKAMATESGSSPATQPTTGAGTGTGAGTETTPSATSLAVAGTTINININVNTNGGSQWEEHSHGHRRQFATGLAALISQVGNGSAHAALQSAFDKLVADFQGAAGTPAAIGTTGSTSTPTAPPAPSAPPAADTTASTGTSGNSSGGTSTSNSAGSDLAVSLQALLSKLQQGLGYGPMGHRAAIGNLVNVTVG